MEFKIKLKIHANKWVGKWNGWKVETHVSPLTVYSLTED